MEDFDWFAPVRSGGRAYVLQFSQFMQEKFCSSRIFLQRTDALAAALGCLLKEIPVKIGISERAMFGYRSGKYPVTAKALRKLEAAEVAAGITFQQGPKSARNAESLSDPKDNPPPDHFPDPGKMIPELADYRRQVAALQAAFLDAAPTMAEVRRRMEDAGAWPPSAEDGRLTAGALWVKYRPK